MNACTKLFASFLLLAGCQQGDTKDSASSKSLSDVTTGANGGKAELRECSGKYRAFGGVKPDEGAFVNFSDDERKAFNKAATAVPGFALYLYTMVLDGQFEVDADLSDCKVSGGAAPAGPCVNFKTEPGEFGMYKVVFEKGADKIASHLPFAAGLAMVSMARYAVKDGKPTFTDLPTAVKADLEEVKNLYLSEAKFDIAKANVAVKVDWIKKLSLDFFAAHALDSSLCNDDLVEKDKAAYPQTMEKMKNMIKGFEPLETAFAVALRDKKELAIPVGLSPFVQRLAENLQFGMAALRNGDKNLGLWGKGGIGGASKVAVGTGPFGRTVFENETRNSGNGFLSSKAGN